MKTSIFQHKEIETERHSEKAGLASKLEPAVAHMHHPPSRTGQLYLSRPYLSAQCCNQQFGGNGSWKAQLISLKCELSAKSSHVSLPASPSSTSTSCWMWSFVRCDIVICYYGPLFLSDISSDKSSREDLIVPLTTS
jgi:hypothetical protein